MQPGLPYSASHFEEEEGWWALGEGKALVYKNQPNLNPLAFIARHKRMARITWSLTSAQRYHNSAELTACIVKEVIKRDARLPWTQTLTL